MAPQELERTLDFILHHEARTAARLDSMSERQKEMQLLLVQMTELAQVQSRRLDRHDETFRSWQVWQREALSRLDEILVRLT